MTSRALAVIASAFLLTPLGGCSTTPAPRAPNDVSSLIVDVEARAGTGDGRGASEGTLSAGYQPNNCCALDVHLSRSYLFGTPDVENVSTVKELTDIGLGVTATLHDRFRLRLRGGFAAAPPKHEYQSSMRSGVGGDVALLVRVLPIDPVRRQVGDGHAQVDFVLGVHGWSLGTPRTSAGLEGEPSRIVALTAGLRLAFDYGIDLR